MPYSWWTHIPLGLRRFILRPWNRILKQRNVGTSGKQGVVEGSVVPSHFLKTNFWERLYIYPILSQLTWLILFGKEVPPTGASKSSGAFGRPKKTPAEKRHQTGSWKALGVRPIISHLGGSPAGGSPSPVASRSRLTTIIRQIHIREGSAKAACVGHLASEVEKGVWSVWGGQPWFRRLSPKKKEEGRNLFFLVMSIIVICIEVLADWAFRFMGKSTEVSWLAAPSGRWFANVLLSIQRIPSWPLWEQTGKKGGLWRLWWCRRSWLWGRLFGWFLIIVWWFYL